MQAHNMSAMMKLYAQLRVSSPDRFGNADNPQNTHH